MSTVTRARSVTTSQLVSLASIVVMWGASFLLIDVAVEDLTPIVVVALRLAFGVAVLAAIPSARAAVERRAWPLLALLAIVWMVAPFSLFAAALRRIDSSVAGMLNGSAPLFTALVAVASRAESPTRRQWAGLAVGLAGVVGVALPQLEGARAQPVEIALVLVAVAFYGVAFNLTGSLQRRHGALPTILRAELAALALVAPLAVLSGPQCHFTGKSLVAVAALGILSTGVAFVLFTHLAGTIGAVRASLVTYFLPVVAVALGVLVRRDELSPISVGGGLLVIMGAWLVGRHA